MINRTFLAIVVFIILVAALFGFFYFSESRHLGTIDSFNGCAENGYPVMESSPRQCRTPDGRLFTEDAPSNANPSQQSDDLSDSIRVDMPKEGAVVTSPLKVTGEARGNWFFEASFPVRLLLENGEELAIIPAQAKGEWMTEEFVPFEATLTFSQPTPQKGTLVLMKDNPSGLPEFDKSMSIPVIFGSSTQATTSIHL